ncbi:MULTISPECIES: hypothetical protein [unclassified Variovorax]|uniref:hypothetical protein n=1 Tax=unclassified Variovorax TaxID=663243 RepID=UPI001BD2A4E1|nr:MULTISPECIES: hypothetical protein [unclassified Variovorax]
MTQLAEISPVDRAHRVIAVTASAWHVAPRAPRRSLSIRMLKRLRFNAPANAPSHVLLAHSW